MSLRRKVAAIMMAGAMTMLATPALAQACINPTGQWFLTVENANIRKECRVTFASNGTGTVADPLCFNPGAVILVGINTSMTLTRTGCRMFGDFTLDVVETMIPPLNCPSGGGTTSTRTVRKKGNVIAYLSGDQTRIDGRWRYAESRIPTGCNPATPSFVRNENVEIRFAKIR